MRKASNGALKHSHCLEEIARLHGFKSFADMKKAADAPAQQATAKQAMTESQRADMACAVAALCTGTSSRTIAATAIEWTERYYGIVTNAPVSDVDQQKDAS